MEGTTWTVTLKLTPAFNGVHQHTGIVIGAPDGSAVGNLFGWTTEWSTDYHLGVWFARGNTAGTEGSGGVLTSSGNAVTSGPEKALGFVYLRIERDNERIALSKGTNESALATFANLTLKDAYKNGNLRLYLFASSYSNNSYGPVVFSDYSEE
jgi:hypothetical protein